MHLSVTEILNFYRCPRLLFLNEFGDKSAQSPPSDFLKKLWGAGRTYEKNVIEFFKFEKPKYKLGDYDSGLKATIELMKEGVDTIYQGVLTNDELVGIPDLLIKTKGSSIFGDYYYYAIDIKGATTAKERYLIQLASYSYLLGEIQEFTPFYGGLLLLDMDLQIKFFSSLLKHVTNGINEGQKILSNPENYPPLFIDSNCQMCQWYNSCLPEAHKNKDLSLVSGINKKIKNFLEKIEIKNYADLANCTEEDLINIEDLSIEKKKEIIIQAQCLNENKIYILKTPEIENNELEVYIDFESDMIFSEKGTELNRIDYLAGLLLTNKNNEEYKSILLEKSEEEFINNLSAYINKYVEAPFYHYGHYEQSIFNEKSLPKTNLINIEKIVKNSMVLPVTSYSLKNIVKILGFKWRNKSANAMQSMCWYSNYLETKDRSLLDLSIEYNHDDCLALWFLKKWLLNIKERNLPAGEFFPLESVSKN